MRRIVIGNFSFLVKIERDRIKHTKIKINGNEIVVRSPFEKPEEDIKDIVLWKLKKLELDKVDKMFLTNFLFFGNPYKVLQADNFSIDHKNKIIFFNSTHVFRAKKYLASSLRNYAKNYLRKVYKKFGLKNLPEVEIRGMKNKLGCLKNEKILLNFNMCFFPKHLIRYVINHELIHYKVNSHNNVFNYLISSVHPNYKEIEKELKKFLIIVGYNKKLQEIYSRV